MDGKRAAAIIGAYTVVLSGPFDELHAYVEEVMGRPVFTHEMGVRAIADEIKEKSKPDFLKVVEWLQGEAK